jgi:hypothetical protein
MSGTDESPDKPLEIDVDKRVDEGYSADDEVTEEEAEQLEKERQERLDPDNRPENALVDNTQREFDPEEGFQVPPEEVENGPEIGADRPEGVTPADEE